MAFNSWQGIKIALLVHGYKKVYMLHFEGENQLHYSQVARCLQLCLDTSDSQGNCFDAFCCAPLVEPCNPCAQAPALPTTAFSVPTGPVGGRSNCIQILQSPLGPANAFPGSFKPTVPPVIESSLSLTVRVFCMCWAGFLTAGAPGSQQRTLMPAIAGIWLHVPIRDPTPHSFAHCAPGNIIPNSSEVWEM